MLFILFSWCHFQMVTFKILFWLYCEHTGTSNCTADIRPSVSLTWVHISTEIIFLVSASVCISAGVHSATLFIHNYYMSPNESECDKLYCELLHTLRMHARVFNLCAVYFICFHPVFVHILTFYIHTTFGQNVEPCLLHAWFPSPSELSHSSPVLPNQ